MHDAQARRQDSCQLVSQLLTGHRELRTCTGDQTSEGVSELEDTVTHTVDFIGQTVHIAYLHEKDTRLHHDPRTTSETIAKTTRCRIDCRELPILPGYIHSHDLVVAGLYYVSIDARNLVRRCYRARDEAMLVSASASTILMLYHAAASFP